MLTGFAFFSAVLLGVCAEPAKEHLPAAARPQNNYFSSLKALEGATFNNVSVQRVEPDGLQVSFVPEGGGLGFAKLKFRSLSESLRQEYGYDAVSGDEFESNQARGQASWQAENLHWEAQKQQAQTEQREQERNLRAQAEQFAAEQETPSPNWTDGENAGPIVWPAWWWNTESCLPRASRPCYLQNGRLAGNRNPKMIGPLRPTIAPMQPRGGSARGHPYLHSSAVIGHPRR
jgi:hypothetical protein